MQRFDLAIGFGTCLKLMKVEKTSYIKYKGTCKLCGLVEVTSEYWGESAFSGGYRAKQHEDDVEKRKESNAFSKHLEIFHPESQGNIEHFEIQVQSVHKKSLTRQKTEAVKIQSSTASNLLNSKAEHRQPALLRVRMVQGDENEIQVPRPRPQQNGGVDGGGGGGGVEEQDQRERRRQGQ